MSRYNSDFPFPVAFPPQVMTDVLAETLSKHGVKQAHVAETAKYAHVTFFFNGGVEIDTVLLCRWRPSFRSLGRGDIVGLFKNTYRVHKPPKGSASCMSAIITHPRVGRFE